MNTRLSLVMSLLSGFVAVAALTTAALAQDARWQYGITEVVPKGQQASLRLVPTEKVSNVRVILKSDRSKKPRKFKIKKIAAGASHRVSWPAPKGSSHWSAEVVGKFGDGEDTVTFEFDVHQVLPLQVGVKKREIYLEEGKAVITANQKLSRAEITATEAGGATVVDETQDLTEQGGPKGGKYVVEWAPPGEEEALKEVRITLYDAHDAYNYLIVLTPFFVELPHEDVAFETASAEIKPAESPKLKKALGVLNGHLSKWGNMMEARLYIGGYTDTVGNAADNRKLSNERARAIARWFRDHGVTLPIYYQGFGESGLAVQTADGVDEAKNRRAVYVLGASAPRGGQFTGGRWVRLK